MREYAAECGAAAEFTVDLQLGFVMLEAVFDDRQAKTRAAVRGTAPGVDPVEAFGEPGQVLRRNPGPSSLTASCAEP